MLTDAGSIPAASTNKKGRLGRPFLLVDVAWMRIRVAGEILTSRDGLMSRRPGMAESDPPPPPNLRVFEHANQSGREATPQKGAPRVPFSID